MIRVQELTRRFGGFTAVDDVSFALEKGEVVGFLGPNGAGKTTTMRMLTGFLPATKGSIEVAGHDVARESMAVRKSIGYLPESVPLYPEHRVEEMLRFQARLHGLSRRQAELRMGEVLERVGMSERRRKLIGTLSKGQRQRIGLSVALLPDPEVLILDEPTSGLDPIQRGEVRTLIGDLARERTVLFSSHILPEIEAVCPRVIILHQGRIVADGAPGALAGGAAFVRMEAVVMDAEEAVRLLRSLPGVRDVRATGRLGIHSGFEIESAEDVREDVGALAAQRGWALRQLSWEQPTLEGLFTRITLGLDTEEALGSAPSEAAEPDVPIEAGQSAEPGGLVDLALMDSDSSDQASGAKGAKAAPALTLSPFEAPAPESPAPGFAPLNPFATPPPTKGDSACADEEQSS